MDSKVIVLGKCPANTSHALIKDRIFQRITKVRMTLAKL